MKNEVKIQTSGGTSQILVNGVEIAPICTGFTIKHDTGKPAVLVLELLCENLDFTSKDIEVKRVLLPEQ